MNVSTNVHLHGDAVLRVYSTAGYTTPNVCFKSPDYGPEVTVFFENDDQLAELGRLIDAYLASKKSCREIDAAISAMSTEELRQAMAPATLATVFEQL